MTESQGALNQITELVDNMPSFSTVCCPGNRPLLERRGVKLLKYSNLMLFIIYHGMYEGIVLNIMTDD